MLLQFLSWHIRRIVIMQMVVDAGNVLDIVQYLCNIVAYDDDGAFLIDLFQHLVHLLLEAAVDVGVGCIEDYYIRL